MNQIVATFYKFVTLTDFETKQKPLLELCYQKAIKGTILLAQEGINGTIAGSRQGLDAVIAYLRCDPRLTDLETKEASIKSLPFKRTKVRLKKEIVTLGIPEINPLEKVGTYVDYNDWNNLISDPEILVIDTRNNYEVEMGSFKGAINPNINSFREFPNYVAQNLNPFKHKQVAMFCTGGIRCEKATSLLINKGFNKVYHLKGGILKYLEKVQSEQSLWDGECFVFDKRVAVKHNLEKGHYEMCLSCGYPISERETLSLNYEYGVSSSHCISDLTTQKIER
ncbi:oxygen-dependent tRNA uridine(34) hydroxylase TrhO [cyanobacterium endosymbiont of Epithemia clementina EcSB]|uniref:oxygen-dependent tRNA uridine(34) hydroxylase TrhO n=1 Tax=cyanobacterium endosymbiont of Epithemia clementina EcSB TaxID=3034674 RepID=UPI00247FE307|nr:rhodanese-related sulfurtransferase [cyanobacterium endosymbiont of Epithemia clementina EcSB]WGT68019.1 rhodanese-related sulfurtransferase [cyanobacterium endosymbiont of Epithemia clementina EcSB]